MDKFDKKIRSRIMSSIKSYRNESTEVALIKLFRKNHIKGWRRKQKIYGKPDFYFPKSKTVVFVDGCFWHGCRCRKRKPKTHKLFWEQKIINNKTRDKIVNSKLKTMGYTVIRIKECEINDKLSLEYFKQKDK